jgi:hypothetical protein
MSFVNPQNDYVLLLLLLLTSLLSVLDEIFSQQIDVNNFSSTNLKFSAFRLHKRVREIRVFELNYVI